MSQKTEEQISEELIRGVDEIKKIRRGVRSPILVQIIREIIQKKSTEEDERFVAISSRDKIISTENFQ